MRRSRAFCRIGSLGLLTALAACKTADNPGDHPLPSLIFNTSAMAPISGAYDGPAVIERSTATDLVLAFDADPSSGGTLPRHANITGLGAVPLPVGATVWLKMNPVLAVPSPQSPRPSRTFSVLTASDGTLLFGVANGTDPSSITAAGLLPMQQTGTSRRDYADECASGTLETTTFDLEGDTTVVIRDGDSRTARVGGIDYDLGLVARRFAFDASSTKCADSGPYSWFQLSVRAHDMAALAAMLPLGQEPACAFGNAELEDVSISLFDTDISVTYDGPAFYQGPGSLEGFDCFQFRVPGLATTPGLPPPMVQACVPPGSLAAPALDAEVWATIPSFGMAVLRKANRGDLIAASISTASGDTSSTEISGALGVPVDVHPGCAYANYNTSVGGDVQIWRLQEVAFGASPAIVVSSQQSAVVPIGGVDCNVWVWDSGSITIVAK